MEQILQNEITEAEFEDLMTSLNQELMSIMPAYQKEYQIRRKKSKKEFDRAMEMIELNKQLEVRSL